MVAVLEGFHGCAFINAAGEFGDHAHPAHRAAAEHKRSILKYLERIPEGQSTWDGECFVFDGRVSVGHGLAAGSYDLCHACRRPISDEDKASPLYQTGVQCPHCAAERSEADRDRFAERQRQITLAHARGDSHLGRKA